MYGGIDMVEIGEKVPSYSLPDTDLKPVDISEVSKGRPTILAFFPGAFTGTCTAELCKFRDMSELNSMGRVYAISIDGPFSNKGFKERNNLNFPILSDYKKEVIKAFGIELQNFAHLDGYTASKRAIFITDSNGVIKYKWVSDDPSVEPNYSEISSALASIK